MSKDPHIANIFSAADDEDCLSLEQLSAYQEGRVQGPERNRMERHLLDCELCAITLESIAEHGVEDIQAGAEEVTERAWSRLEQKEKRKRRGAFFWIAAAASVAILITVGFFALNGPSEEKINDALRVAQRETPAMDLDSQTRADIAMAKTAEEAEESPEATMPTESLEPTPELAQPLKNVPIATDPANAKPVGGAFGGSDVKGGIKPNDGFADNIRRERMADDDDLLNEDWNAGSDFGTTVNAKESPKAVTVSPTAPVSKGPIADSKGAAKGTAQEESKKYKADRSEQAEKTSPSKDLESITASPAIAASEEQVGGFDDGDMEVSEDESNTLSDVVVANRSHRTVQRDKSAKEPRGRASTLSKADPAPVAKPSPDYYTQGMVAYQQGNYRDAAANLRSATELTPTNLQAHLYAADAFLRISQPQAALFHCERILAQPGNSVLEDAEWFKALAYLQLKEGRKAKSQLEAIVARNGKYKTRAEETLNSLK